MLIASLLCRSYAAALTSAAMNSAMETASVKVIVSVKLISTVKFISVVKSTRLTPSNVSARVGSATITVSVITRPAIPAASCISAIPEPCRVAPVIPRARADKYAVYEVVRAVEAIGSAGVGIVIVVAIGTNRRPGYVGMTNNHTDWAHPHSN